MFVCCGCYVLSGRGLCDELITRPEESYRLWCVVVCDLETSRMRRPWPALGRSATGNKQTQRRITVGRTSLDEGPARRRDLYLTTHTHNTHNRQTSMPPVGFELTVSAGERPHTHALNYAAIGSGIGRHVSCPIDNMSLNHLT